MKLLLVGAARENSFRVPNKMIKPLEDTSLFELYIKKLEKIASSNNLFSNVIMAINRKDKTLWDIAKDTKHIQIVERDDKSISQKFNCISETQSYLKKFDEEYIININGCFPFLKVETILNISNFYLKNSYIKSLTCVKERHNHFWEIDTKKPINSKNPTILSTSLLPPVLENVNHILIYNKNYMFEHECYWDYTDNNPYLYIVTNDEETLDIDTQMEFDICESLYRIKYGNKENFFKKFGI